MKNKNIYLIPTDKPSRLGQVHEKLSFFKDKMWDNTENWRCKNIYITNTEEIKEGDWFYVKTPNIYGGNVAAKCLGFGENCWSEHILTDVADEKGYHPSHCVKIILTTDQDLIKNGVQAIDDEFLEWFVKNSSCEEVKLENHVLEFGYNHYKTIIPKEESKRGHIKSETKFLGIGFTLEDGSKQFIPNPALKETLEDSIYQAIGLAANEQGIINQALATSNVVNIVQERMYSEEELREAFRQGQSNMHYSDNFGLDSKLTEQQWFEQFKKK